MFGQKEHREEKRKMDRRGIGRKRMKVEKEKETKRSRREHEIKVQPHHGSLISNGKFSPFKVGIPNLE